MASNKKSRAKAAIHPVLDQAKLRSHQERLRAASEAVDAVMHEHGLLDDGEKMICEDVIVIGPDGVPRHEKQCHPIQT